nr:hypothetical protein CFP56_31787 [Quercus suber]
MAIERVSPPIGTRAMDTGTGLVSDMIVLYCISNEPAGTVVLSCRPARVPRPTDAKKPLSDKNLSDWSDVGDGALRRTAAFVADEALLLPLRTPEERTTGVQSDILAVCQPPRPRLGSRQADHRSGLNLAHLLPRGPSTHSHFSNLKIVLGKTKPQKSLGFAGQERPWGRDSGRVGRSQHVEAHIMCSIQRVEEQK